jgi:hypothetical protein
VVQGAKLALIVSYIVLIGSPVLFLCISLFTGQWSYFFWSIPPSFTAGFTGMIVSKSKFKSEGKRV